MKNFILNGKEIVADVKKAPSEPKNISMENIMKRARNMRRLREEMMQHVDDFHVRIQQGNSKTGNRCYTVSLIPIIDCLNCESCKRYCYDILNVCFQPAVQVDRARNSAIHKTDPDRFWSEIEHQCQALCVDELRINVGGDLNEDDFKHIYQIEERNPKLEILFFTKSFKEINHFISEYGMFPDNCHPHLSGGTGLVIDNPYHLPESHIVWADGTTTETVSRPKAKTYFCSGNCTECFFNRKGCVSNKVADTDEDVNITYMLAH